MTYEKASPLTSGERSSESATSSHQVDDLSLQPAEMDATASAALELEEMNLDHAGANTSASNTVQKAKRSCRSASVRDIDLSDDALAVCLGRKSYDDNARFVAATGQWFFWDDTRWAPDTKDEHLSNVRDFLRVEANQLVSGARFEANRKPDGDAALIKWAKDNAKHLKSRKTINAVSALAAANRHSAAGINDFDRDALTLGTPEGAVCLKTGNVLPPERAQMITKLTACGPASVGSHPKLFLQFLDQIFHGDQEMIAFMQRLAGYALTGKTTEPKLFFCHGSGRNGKGVFMNTLHALLGDYARVTGPELLMATSHSRHKSELAVLDGKRLVTTSELPKHGTWNEVLIKALTGGDTISANFMHKNPFDFKPAMTLIVSGNDKPQLNDVSNAMRSRMVLVPFSAQITEDKQDPDLEKKLMAEGPEILRWAIDGALAWQQHGLAVPKAVRDASIAYLEDEDAITSFLNDETADLPNEATKTHLQFERYKQWCRQEGIQFQKRKDFVAELKARGLTEQSSREGMKFLGLGLN